MILTTIDPIAFAAIIIALALGIAVHCGAHR